MARLLATLAGDRLTVLAEGRTPAWAVEARVDGAADVAAQFSALREEVTRARLPRRLLVRVEAPTLQSRQLTGLPPVRTLELERLVARSASRFFRQNGHPLFGTAAWLERAGEPRRIALAAAAELQVLEAIVAGATEARLELEDIVPATAPAGQLSLLPPLERTRRARSLWRDTARNAALVLGLWVAVLAAVDMRRRQESRQFDAELHRLEPARHALVAARAAMDSATDMVTALDQGEAQRTGLAGFLGLIVRALPDSAVVTSLHLDLTGEAVLVLRAPRAVAVVQAMEHAPGLAQVRLDAPAISDSLGGIAAERFTLRLRRVAP